MNLLSVARALIRDVVRITDTQHQAVFGDENFDAIQNENLSHREPIIQALLTVIEHCICHGLRRELRIQDTTFHSTETAPLEMIRNSASALRRAKNQVMQTANSILAIPRSPLNPWPVVLHMEQCHPVADKLSTHVLSLSEVRSGLGKFRVWIRYALMHKVFYRFLFRFL